MKKKLGLVIVLFLIFSFFGCNSSIKTATEMKSNNSNVKKNKTNDIILEKLKAVYPELYEELLKLPELKEDTDQNNKAIEQIVQLGLESKNKSAFSMMINEGLSENRKYCTPLQGLFWIACDRNINKDNPLIESNFTVASLVEDAWTTTTTSKHFSSERWKNFEEVTERLNSPQMISIYMEFNVSYSYTPNEKEGIKSAKEIFTNKKGACYDQALLASYLLKKNGYTNAWATSVAFDKIVDGFYAGHIGNIYENPIDKQYYSMDFNENGYYYVHGPFNSVEKAAEKICSIGSRGKATLKKYQCYEINLDKGTYIKTSDYFFD